MGLPSVRRAWQALREEGLRAFWFKLLGKLGYRRMYLLERVLTESLAATPPPAGVTLAWLRRDQLDEFVGLRSLFTAAAIGARFDNGDVCLSARVDGRLVGAMWACVKRPYLQFLERDVPLAPGEVYLFDAYVIPAVRGRSIAPLLSSELLRHFQEGGYRRAIRATLPDNAPALRAHAKAGFHPYTRFGYVKLGRWRHDFMRPVKKA
jgi:ribosomal protein S18 acetylase RimI-like enzyme